MRAYSRFIVVQQTSRHQGVERVRHHLARHTEFHSKISVRWQHAVIVRGDTDNTEPPTELLVG